MINETVEKPEKVPFYHSVPILSGMRNPLKINKLWILFPIFMEITFLRGNDS
jgi:hypothetical protein